MTSDNDMAKTLRDSLGRLDVQRKSLEMEAEAIVSELTAKPENGGEPMGIDTPLVDREGYPRGDIDVYRARDLRNRLAIIRTDNKSLMKQIEGLLVQLAAVKNPGKKEEETKEEASRAAPKPKPKYDPKTGKWVVKNWDGTVAGVEDGEKRTFDNLQGNTDDILTNAASTGQTPSLAATRPPFAKIDQVAPLSPAAEAGLKEGDLVVEFGSIHHDNHENLRALMPVVAVAADAQRAISISLLRRPTFADPQTMLRVELTPKPWPGRGLIGCHIVPYS
ncbi:ATPase regulatory subunit 9 [Seminavis robusta]|uniref:ATPase regulatory subunit 9 n=1 Tax=Seminavis robusta TaxID=568900 RepID=A0A9N8EHT3_9STRA|nr:ATPase regulatory subunit 9 [Seminavis robusta]|eukprot:Sro958_g224650.1 ATPase regulatory subunit 9 (277) ;mRNA; f:21276-22225